MINIKFAKVRSNAVIPSKREEDAGYDIYPCFEEDYIEIKPLETKLIPIGIASAFPRTHYFQMQERGSTGSKGIKYSAGVVDSGYRGEWFVPITNCNNKSLYIVKDEVKDRVIFQNSKLVHPYNKAICQAVLLEVPKVNIEEITFEELQKIPSERMNGRLGSSGK